MRRQKAPYRLGFLGGMAVVTAILIFMYATTFLREQSTIIQNAIEFLFIGVGMAFFTVGLKFEVFKMETLGESILWMAICVVIIWMVQATAPFTLEVEVLNKQLFAVLMGVSEECFFRLFLCTFIKRMTGAGWLAIILSSFGWSVYHIARYGANMGTLLIIGVAGCALGWVMLESKMGDGPIFAHALINFLATRGA